MSSVCAVVVTYNRKDLLQKCLNALLNQTQKPDHILVVDNASTDGTVEVLKEQYPNIEILSLPTNVGGAGGFFEGMKYAYEAGYKWLWIMDDDGIPDKECLMKLLNHSNKADVLVPIQVNSQGEKYGAGFWKGRYYGANLEGQGTLNVELFSFVGPLIHRKVITTCGLPKKEFFIWADDLEYSLRIRENGLRTMVILDAIFHHEYGGESKMVKRFGRLSYRSSQPPWKNYYGSRNQLLMLKTLKKNERIKSYLWNIYLLFRLTVGDILYESDWKKRIIFRWYGFFHGMIGITGKKVDPRKNNL